MSCKVIAQNELIRYSEIENLSSDTMLQPPDSVRNFNATIDSLKIMYSFLGESYE
jgi:hypothetical protein